MAKERGPASCDPFFIKVVIIGTIFGLTIFSLIDKNEAQVIQSWKKAVISLLPEMDLDVKIGSRGNQAKCDVFHGHWVPDKKGPAYTNNTCRFITESQNCMSNGRPDNGYLHWRWKPYGCDLPSLDAEKFLKSVRGKTIGFIGDSIIRNQLQSLVCMLSVVEEPLETSQDETYTYSTFYFPSHNVTIIVIWAPLLVKYRDDRKINDKIQVYLDVVDEKWAKDYHKFDYVVISSGQWYLKKIMLWEQGKFIGCHNCYEKAIKEIDVEYPYRKALRTVFDFITSSDHKPFVLFRTWMPDHFENGAWYDGGICNRTRPYREGEYAGKELDQQMRNIEADEFKKVVGITSEKGIHMELFDTFQLAVMRPDGHPGPYRHPYNKNTDGKVQNDCLHSCLPGPIDAWNDIMGKMILSMRAEKSSAFEHKFVI